MLPEAAALQDKVIAEDEALREGKTVALPLL